MTYKPGQRRGAKGTDLGGEFIGVKSVARALIKMMSPHEAAQHDAEVKARTPKGGPAIGRLMAGASPAHKKMASRDRAKASRLHDQIRTLDEQHAAPQFQGSRLSRPEERRQNRLQAERLRSELAPIQRRVDTADAIAADHRETHGAAPTPGASLLEAARAHVAAMQRGTPEPAAPAKAVKKAAKRAPAKKAIPEAPSAPDLTGANGLSTDPAVRQVQVENRIRQAYRDREGANQWMSLADLRDRLGDVSRDEQDAALKRLIAQPGVLVVPESNQSALTARDRAGAARIGGQTKHHISFADPSPRPLPDGMPKASPELTGARGLSTDPAIRQVQVDNRVRQAYAKLAAKPGDWVGLADMRAAMPDLSREEQDIAFRRLAMGQFGPSGSRVIPIANSKGLSERDRAAALRMGGEDHHALSIENSSPTPLPGAKAAPAKKTAAARVARAKAAPRSPGPLEDADVTEVRAAVEQIRAAKSVDEADAILGTKTDGELRRMVRVAGLEPALGMSGWRTEQYQNTLRNQLVDRAVINQAARDARAARVAGPAAAKMTRAKAAAVPPEVSRANLAAATSREEARTMLSGMTIAQLKAVYPTPGATKKADIIDAIIERTVGSRINSATIRQL